MKEKEKQGPENVLEKQIEREEERKKEKNSWGERKKK